MTGRLSSGGRRLSHCGFLLWQLVARDFKTRYKRSVLGVFWSLLNPLLTTAVQYLVFSAVFRSGVENFPLYLLSGVVCFSFYSEAVSAALTSVVGNAALITKVHVPIVVYPLSRVLSSAVNLAMSLPPLLAAAVLTGAAPRASWLLLPAGLAFLVCLGLGVGLALAASMVFFRDTQFLWGVASMLWMYLTPIIYPEAILPARLRAVLVLNPLRHIIVFVRTVLLEGRAPEGVLWAGCALSAGLALWLGTAVFLRAQDKFIMYL